MPPEDPLTPAELAFRALLESPRQLAEWAATVRAHWHATPEGRVATARVHGGLLSSPGKARP